MRSRLIEGKTIKRIHQTRRDTMSCGRMWDLDAIEFTDGSFLRFLVVEEFNGGEYGIQAVYPGKDPRP